MSEDQILRGAADRIEKYRKGNVVLRLVDSSGKALAPGQSVQVVEQRHQFLFGANLFGMGKIDSPALESAYQQWGVRRWLQRPFSRSATVGSPFAPVCRICYVIWIDSLVSCWSGGILSSRAERSWARPR